MEREPQVPCIFVELKWDLVSRFLGVAMGAGTSVGFRETKATPDAHADPSLTFGRLGSRSLFVAGSCRLCRS